ncbi:predicted protein [Aspergillus terreus NIH2624]|uniref:BTB domain-containing protein n=1 Tax=Aspergillus terreus (strain NIH 2624 / FGSC A1156) TaxID=341663 RepID=Q0C8Z3_ASPTN|nr:uncharacterized protein ATEG_09841 [Aspergillus terreus NIH2624]EAU30032.1 predicted protein [Aspergillus terreus NIH2624]
MVKGKHKKKKSFLQTARDAAEENTMDTPPPPEPYSDPEIEEYTQRETSPYSTETIFLYIGSSEYSVPEYYLRQYSQLSSRSGSAQILESVDPDIGHTLVHYLYTGTYETLRCSSSEGPRRAIEFRRSVHVYHAARMYEIDGLVQYAKEYMRRFDDAATLFDILDVGREVFSKLPEDETWFQEYIEEKMNSALEADQESFKDNLLRYGIGRDIRFDPLILRILLDTFIQGHEASPKAAVDDGSMVSRCESPQVEHEDHLEPPEQPIEEVPVEMDYVPEPVDEPDPEVADETSPIDASPPPEEVVEEHRENGKFYPRYQVFYGRRSYN